MCCFHFFILAISVGICKSVLGWYHPVILNKKGKVLVSSCLIGINSQWDSGEKRNEKLIGLVKSGSAVFMCPEQAGGMPTPREPSEIEYGKTAKDILVGAGRVLTKSGRDVTKEFVDGAKQVLALCKELGITTAVLKEKSPSCGSIKTYDGTFTGTKISGKGITAELLTQHGIQVYSEENFPDNL